MGTYQILEVLNESNPEKFSCMISFNGGASERYEVESVDPQTIAETLQAAADAALAAVPASAPEIQVENGQIVL